MKPSHLILASLLVIALLVVVPVQAATYTSQYPPIQSYDYVKVTNPSQFVERNPNNATDPTKSLIGASAAGNDWLTYNAKYTNQRFHIDLGSEKIIRRIYYENSHLSGGFTTRGAKNVTVWGTNNAAAFAALVYTSDISWTQITASQLSFDQHIPVNVPDPKNIILENSVGYRYYALKFPNNWGSTEYMGLRRIELQTEDGYSLSPVSSFTSTNKSVATNATEGWEGHAPFRMQFTNTSTNPPHDSFVWNYTEISAPTIPVIFNQTEYYNPIYTFTVAGNYLIELNVTGTYGTNVSTQITWVNVTSPPSPPVASFTASIYAGYAPLTVYFTDTSTNNPTSWAWGARNLLGNDTWFRFSTVKNPISTFTAGKWSINLTATNAYGSDISDDVWINISSGPAPSPTPTIGPIINPSVDTQDYLCRNSYTRWICEMLKPGPGPTGQTGTPGSQNMTRGPAGPPGGAGGQVLYFHHEPVPDPVGYEGLDLVPAGSAEEDESVIINSGTGAVVVDPYITVDGFPGVNTWSAGLWRFRTYHYVSSAVGTTRAIITAYNRTASGNMTELFTAISDDINDLEPTEQLFSHVQLEDYEVSDTDRLVLNVSANATHPSDITFHFVYEGSVHTSHVQSPLSLMPSSINESYAYLPGRPGSQTLHGGNAANEDLTLDGTNHATKDSSYVILQPDGGSVGIGTAAPSTQLHTTGAVRFSNYGAGTATFDANGVLSAVSDERLKTNIQPFTSGLTAVLKIDPISYHYSAASGLDTVNEYTGFSAQNLETSVPSAVYVKPDGTSSVIYVEEDILGNGTITYVPTVVSGGTKSISDRSIIAALVNAVKDQQGQIDDLKNRISELEKNNET